MGYGLMNISETRFRGLFIVECQANSDIRGSFTRLYCEGKLSSILQDRRILQINFSQTSFVGTVRGLHFQARPYSEMKFVRCLKGAVWDVAVDLRHDSPTFGQWHAEELSGDNMKMLVIPEGFAHGFQALEAGSQLLYLHTANYNASSEQGIRFDDPRLNVAWPFPINNVSVRDMSLPNLDENFLGL